MIKASPGLLKAFDVDRFVFPIVSMKSAGELAYPTFYGTAYCISPGVFMTASHVLSDAAVDGTPGIAVVRPKPTAKTIGDEVEHLGSDCAIFRVEMGVEAPVTFFADDALDIGKEVEAYGYPFAVDRLVEPDVWSVTVRAFAGRIQTRRKAHHLQGNPICYELSMRCPPGLSGAPIVLQSPLGALLVGMVVGEQTLQAAGHYSLDVGVALDVSGLLSRSSSLLGMALGEYMRGHGAVSLTDAAKAIASQNAADAAAVSGFVPIGDAAP